ncbi:phage tail tape measure protein [Halalkalibacter oceani]|uniref:phage tail tape measure protein n=1 Tax=Halalkalibacter oceani TaxID=1653776 RepID=UPI00339AA737
MNSLKTIFSRITTMDGSIDALNSVGIAVHNMEGDVRPVANILDELGSKWSSLNSQQQQSIALQIAGRYQLSRFLVLMNNHSRAIEATNTAMNSAGSGMRENEQYLQSLEARINRFKNSWTEMAITVGDAFLSDGIVAFSETMATILSSSSDIISVIGFLPPALGAATVATVALNSSMRTNITTAAAQAGTLTTLRGIISGVGASATATGAALATMGRFMIGALPPVALIMLGSFALEKLFSAYMKNREEVRQLEQEMNKSTEAIRSQGDTVDELANRFQELEKLKQTTGLTNEQEEEFVSLQNQLAEILPTVASGLDEKGNKLIESSDLLQQEIDLLKEKIELEKEQNRLNLDSNINSLQLDIDKEINNIDKLKKHVIFYEEEISRLQNDNTASAFDIEWNQLQLFATKQKIIEAEQKILNLNKQIGQTVADTVEDASNLSNLDFDWISEIKKNGFDGIDLNNDELIKFTKTLSSIRKSFGEAFSTDQLKTFSQEQLQILSHMSVNLQNGTKDFSDWTDALKNAGFSSDDAESAISALNRAVEETAHVQEMVDLGVFRDLEGTIPVKTTKEYNEVIEEGIPLYIEVDGVMQELTDTLDSQSESIDLTEKSFEELTQYIAEKTNPTLSDYMALASATSDELDILSSAHKELITDGKLSQSSLDKLIEAYPDFIKVTGLSTDKMLEFITASKQQRMQAIRDQKEMTRATIEETEKRIAEMQKEIDAMGARTLAQIRSYNAQITSLRNALSNTTDRSEQERLSNEITRISGVIYDLNTAFQEQHTILSDLKKENEEATNSYTYLDYAVNDLAESYHKNTEANDKNNKSQKDSIYLANKREEAIKALNRELTRQQNAQNNLLKGSQRWLKAKQEEINLTQKLREELANQRAELEKLQNAGIVQQSGVVNSSSMNGGSSSSSYSGQYATYINKAAAQYGIDPNLIAAVIQTESNFNSNARSSAGAQGLMQLMPATARELGVTNINDPEQNIMAGTKYLAQQLERFSGDIEKALAAYNAGPGNVQKWVNNGQWGNIPFKETRNYIPKVLNEYGKFNNNSSSTSGVSNDVASYYLNNFRQTSQFGMRNGRMHNGIDLAPMERGKQGDPIKALMGGVVKSVGYQKDGAGYYITLEHMDGSVTKYFHLMEMPSLKVGQQVQGGQQIGKLGNTGRSSGAHLHLEYLQNGKAVNPLPVLQQIAQGGGDFAQYQQGLANQAQTIEDLKVQEHQLYLQQQKIQEDYLNGLIENHNRSIERLERSIQEQQNIIDQNPEGSAARNQALNQINYLQSLIDKELNEIQYKAGQYSNRTDISEQGRYDFAVLRDETRLRRQGITIEQAERNATRTEEKVTQLQGLIEQQNRSLQHVENELNKLDPYSPEYREMLDDRLKHENEALRLMNRIKEEYTKAIESGKLTEASINQFKQALSDTNLEIEEQSRLIKEIDELFAESVIGEYNRELDKLSYQYDLSTKTMALYKEGSKDYMLELSKQASITTEQINKEKELQQTLLELLRTKDLSIQKQEEYNEMIRTSVIRQKEFQLTLLNTREYIQNQIADQLTKQQTQYLDTLKNKYDELNKTLESLIKPEDIFNANEFKHSINEIIYELERIDGQFKKNAMFVESASGVYKNLDQTRKSILDMANAIEKMANSTSNNQSELEKMIRSQSQYANQIKDEIELIDQRIRQRELEQKKIEDSLQNQIDLRQKEIEQLDEQYQKEDRLKRLRDLEEEMDKVYNDRRFEYIDAEGNVILTYDRGRYNELVKQRDEMLEQYEREDIKKARQDEINELQEKLNKTREIHRAEINDINLQRNALNTLYNALVANTRDKMAQLKSLQDQHLEDTRKNWDDIIESVREGTMTYSELMNSWYGSALEEMKDFGLEVAEEVNKIKDLYNQLFEVQVPEPPKQKSGSSGSSSSKTGSTIGRVIGGFVGGGAGGAVGGAIGGAIGSIRDKITKKHDGGIVEGGKPNKVTQLMNTLMNANADEQAILALKNELFSPEENLTKYALPNMRNLMSKVTPNLSLQPQTTETHYHIHKDILVKADNPYDMLQGIRTFVNTNKG